MLVLQDWNEEKDSTVELLNNFFEGETYHEVVNLPLLQDLAENIAENHFRLPELGVWKEKDYTVYLECVELEGEKCAGDAMIQAAKALAERKEADGMLVFVKVFGKMKLTDLYEAGEWIQNCFAGKDILFQAQHSEKWDNQYIAIVMLVSLQGASV